jgi:glycosyltransferase involved in cell wall biosynthesis
VNRIALDLALLAHAPYTGMASYAQGLLRGLRSVPEAADWQWLIVAAHDQELSADSLPAGAEVVRLPPPRWGAGPDWAARQWFLPERLRALGVDVYHAPGFMHNPLRPAPLLGRLGEVRRVVTIHDVIPLRYPALHGHGPAGYARRGYYRLVLRRLARCAWIITDSQFSARDLLRHTRVAPQRLAVIPLAPPDDTAGDAVSDPHPDGAPFILHVGGDQPHKNVPVLLRAYAAVRAALPAVALKLVLVGYYAGLEAGLRRDLPDHAAGVTSLGHVSRPALAQLYRRAAALVFPSLCEGFGLPPLEAMAWGCPVVASNAAALPEVVGDAGLLVAPSDVAGLALAIQRVLCEPGLASALRDKGRRRAAQFSWTRTARQTMNVYAAAQAAR